MRFAPLLLVLVALVALGGAAHGRATGSSSLASISAGHQDNPAHVLGDANCDGIIDSLDALQVLRSAAAIQFNADCILLGNVDCSAAIDPVDALGIMRIIAGLPSVPATPGCPTIGSASMRILTLDKFGDGVVSGSPGGISCGDRCTTMRLAVPDGASAILDARADGGSYLDHWSGCDSSSGNGCSLTLTADKSAFATFALDNIKVAPVARAIQSAPISVDSNTYCFAAGALAGVFVAVGDVIVGQGGGGFLRRVESVNASIDGDACFGTSDASLEDVIDHGTIVVHQDLSTQAALAGASAAASTAAIESPISLTFQGGVSVGGSLSFEPSLDMAIKFDGFDLSCLCYPLHEVKSVLTLKAQTTVSVSADAGFALSAHKQVWPPPGTPPLAHILVPVGPIVLDFEPELNVDVGMAGSASGSLESSVTAGNTYTAGVHYLRDQGWHTIWNNTPEYNYSAPHQTSSVEVKAFIEPQFSVKLYGIAGPYVSVAAYGRWEADPNADPWWNVYAGVEGSVGFGVDVPIFGRIADFSATLLRLELLLAHAGGPKPPSGGQIAFEGGDGAPGIYTMDGDGANQRRIGSGNQPAWSPDGTRIAFDCGTAICIMKADGTQVTTVTPGTGPVWSPDGDRLLFERLGAYNLPDIYVIKVDGTSLVNLTRHNFGFVGSPAWSPNGSQVAFIACPPSVSSRGDSEVYIIDSDGSGLRDITNNPANDGVACFSEGFGSGGPKWSPDGNEVVFLSSRDPRGIYIAESDGSGARFLASGDGARWSPTGESLLYLRFDFSVSLLRCTGYLYTIKRDGSGEREILSLAAAYETGIEFGYCKGLLGLTWSPDGSRILFAHSVQPDCRQLSQSAIYCPTDIYVVGADGQGLMNLTPQGDNGGAEWRP